jgi:ParB-like chromosome segregation protein Spo0J
MIESIAISLLRRRRDARAVNAATVAALAESIAEIGVLNPLCVRKKEISVNGELKEGFEIVAGVHRYEAASRAGLAEVPCLVIDHDDLRAELAMIDENLCRAELSPADRATTTIRRKRIYEELHPETRPTNEGGGGRKNATRRQLGDDIADRFTASTAAATGKSERAVQRDAERGKDIVQEAIDLLRGTELDTGAFLDRLKKVPQSDQIATVRRALDGVARQAEDDRKAAADRARQSKINSDNRSRAAMAVAAVIHEFVPDEHLDPLRANLAIAATKDVLTALAKLAPATSLEAAE